MHYVTYEWVMSQTNRPPAQQCRYSQHDFISSWHDSHICDMTHSNVTWLIHMWHDSIIRDMTAQQCRYSQHDSLVRDMTHIYVTWLIWMRHASYICSILSHTDKSCDISSISIIFSWLIYISHIYPSCHVPINQMWRDSLVRDVRCDMNPHMTSIMGWLQWVGAFKL